MHARPAAAEAAAVVPESTACGDEDGDVSSDGVGGEASDEEVVVAQGADGRVVTSRGVSRGLLRRLQVEASADAGGDVPQASGDEAE